MSGQFSILIISIALIHVTEYSMFQCVLSYRSETGSISGSSVLQKLSDIDALRRFILRTAELYNYKNPVQHNMLFLLFYIIIILASISVNIIA